MAYWDDVHLKVAHCANAACTGAATISLVDFNVDVGDFAAIAIGADGLPVISYLDQHNLHLKVAHCSDRACSGVPTISTVDSAAGVGFGTSITIGADLLPIVSYYDKTNQDLKVAHCGDTACTSAATITVVDRAGPVGLSTGIAIGEDGLPIVSYIDNTNGYLKVVKCNNRFCE